MNGVSSMPWKEYGIAGTVFGLLVTAGSICARHLNGRVNKVEEVEGKIFDKLDVQNREIGEVKTEIKGMKEVVSRIESKIDDGNNKR